MPIDATLLWRHKFRAPRVITPPVLIAHDCPAASLPPLRGAFLQFGHLARPPKSELEALLTAIAKVGSKTFKVHLDGCKTRHRAGSWHRERRAVARIEATRFGLDIRFVVTSLDRGSGEWLYENSLLRALAGGKSHQAAQGSLASDRTSCRSALANHVRLVLHTAAYWLMLAVPDAIPKERDLAKAEFATLLST
jgi:Transposase DDE domain group 1